MDDLISKLSEIRSNYNCFNEADEPYYRALSDAIKKLSERVDGDTISREVAIIQLSHNKCGNDEYDIAVQHDIETIKALPPAQPDAVTASLEELINDYGEDGYFIVEGVNYQANELLNGLKINSSVGEKFRKQITKTIVQYFMKFGD